MTNILAGEALRQLVAVRERLDRLEEGAMETIAQLGVKQLRDRNAALEAALQRLVNVTGELSYNQVGSALWTEFVEARTEARAVLGER